MKSGNTVTARDQYIIFNEFDNTFKLLPWYLSIDCNIANIQFKYNRKAYALHG